MSESSIKRDDATTPVADGASPPPHRHALWLRGEDALTFLQGQISQDLTRVDADRAAAASLNSPKGRVIATMVVARHDDGFLLLLAPDHADAVLRRLRMYVLRARVQISTLDAPVHGIVGDAALQALGLPAPGAAWECRRSQRELLIRAPGRPRCWLIGEPPPALREAPEGAFAAADIACGMPCIGSAQSERHVAQHLGLDRLGALSFDKGCYTGQEVIARIHWRGGVNRLPLRLRGAGPAPAANTALLDADGAAVAEVVNAAPEAGHCELLAVHRGKALPARLWLADGRELHRHDFEALSPPAEG